ncbi:AI-2E family transporter [Aeromicrobium sp. Root495]|uniref:AI-2E family transporter n=1 Tax=Aeromicrobium sp. Root495 TaxID=1736550 RepID=UPI001F2B8E5F|nr:AI-2E family transporter [Aeromicrobium sp. Root495]
MSAREPRYEVPIGVEIATQWAWRMVVIAAAGLGIFWLLRFFSEVTVPLAVGLLGTALTIGAVDWLDRRGLPRVAATFVVVLTMLLGFAGLIVLVGAQLAGQFDDLRAQVIEGIDQVQDWAHDGPLQLSDNQLNTYVDKISDAIATFGRDGAVDKLAAVGTSLTHFLAGFFIALFASFFFLYEGDRIWAFFVLLFPKAARARVHSSGGAAWTSLTAFVRATVLVALTDAVFIALGAWALGVPLALAIGAIVFVGAFVPILGALLSGMVAVLVALVAQGPITALLMLLVVVLVQQLESHVLQPFLLGRFVAVHPLAIIIAIAAGVSISGVVGALVAVPTVACLNSVVRHLAEEAGTPFDDDGLPEDPAPDEPPGDGPEAGDVVAAEARAEETEES